MVEFAIVLPMLLLIVFGVLYFSEFLNYSANETHLAAEAARFAAVNVNPSTSTDLQHYIISQASPGLQSTTNSDVPVPVQVYLSCPSGCTTGNPVRACVTATVHFLPFLGVPDTTITQSATMRLEQTPGNWTVNPSSSC